MLKADEVQLGTCALDDWFVLNGGTNWASVEGDAEQWRLVSAALRARRAHREKRLAVECGGDSEATFWSPRNSRGDVDEVIVSGDLDRLADHIDKVLAVYAKGGPDAEG